MDKRIFPLSLKLTNDENTYLHQLAESYGVCVSNHVQELIRSDMQKKLTQRDQLNKILDGLESIPSNTTGDSK